MNNIYTTMKDTVLDYWNTTDKHIRLDVQPGSGKTHLTAEFIKDHPELKVIVVYPNHSIPEGDNDIESMLKGYGVNFMHIYGKNQKLREMVIDSNDNVHIDEKYCLREEKDMYFPGCKYLDGGEITTCPYHDICAYNYQFLDYGVNVYICIIENLQRIGNKLRPDLIIFDESFETKMLKEGGAWSEEVLTETLKLQLTHFLEPDVDMPDNLHFRQPTVEKKFTVNTERLYFLHNYLNCTKNIHVKYSKKYDSYSIYGEYTDYLPTIGHYRIMFNCATTDYDVMCKITETNREDWLYFTYHKELVNPIVKVNYEWSKTMSEKFLPELSAFMDEILFHTMENHTNGKIAIVTKKDFRMPILRMIGEPQRIDIITHGNSRGSNNWNQKYLLQIIFSRFGMNRKTQIKYRNIGFNKDLIWKMEQSELRQGLYRTRPNLHPTTPIILMCPDGIMETKYKMSPWNISNFELYYGLKTKEIIAKGIGKLKSKGMVKFSRWIRDHVYGENPLIMVRGLKEKGLKPREIALKLELPIKKIYKLIAKI